ncbi:hypothetical protein [Haladaptatus cibarius]|uniref:hypothetical protein n=1 Tax=Haladaptatus cibarius TaxID=453847 RepID=UPI000ABC8AE6|nr:hypothetical protein [Haladaptatus cibarius]
MSKDIPNGMSRRQYMKSASIAGASAIAPASAKSVSQRKEVEVNQLREKKASKTLSIAENDDEFQNLIAGLKKDGRSINLSKSDKSAYEIVQKVEKTDQKSSFRIASFNLEDSNSNETIEIAARIRDNDQSHRFNPFTSNLIVEPMCYVHRNPETNNSGEISTQSTLSQKATIYLADGSGPSIESEAINETHETIKTKYGSVNKSEYTLSINSKDGVSIQGANPICGAAPDISCNVCMAAIGVTNEGICTLGSAAYCAIATSQTVIGPVACAGLFFVVCTLLNVTVWNPKEICNDMCLCEDGWMPW